jgi:homocysteine S-methyltransferase
MNNQNLQSHIMAQVQILDGGLGTSLNDLYNIKFDSTTTPLWASHLLISDPATLQACQHDFGIAGVDILLTATYQVSVEGFARTKTPQHPNGIPRTAVGPFLKTAVDIAEQAKVRDSTSIALSLGPYGACMIPGQEYSGAYDAEHDSEESLYRWHLDRLRMFVEADEGLVSRVRYVAFETLPRVDEVRAVRRAIRDSGIELPFWIACVFPRDDEALPDGSSVGEVVRAAVGGLEGGAVPWGIGINCTKMHKLSGLVDAFGRAVAEVVKARQIDAVPSLVLYPDGTNGEVYNTTTQTWEKVDDGLSDGVSTTEIACLYDSLERDGHADLNLATLGGPVGTSG